VRFRIAWAVVFRSCQDPRKPAPAAIAFGSFQTGTSQNLVSIGVEKCVILAVDLGIAAAQPAIAKNPLRCGNVDLALKTVH
jgi:hypothetical protein